MAWSAFRRHQATAGRCHAARRARRRRASANPPTVRVLASADLALTDARWARVAPLLPPQKRPTGRPANDHRTMLSGMLWVARTGASWREVPACFGPWPTVHSRYRIWRRDGVWQRILDALAQENGHSP